MKALDRQDEKVWALMRKIELILEKDHIEYVSVFLYVTR